MEIEIACAWLQGFVDRHLPFVRKHRTLTPTPAALGPETPATTPRAPPAPAPEPPGPAQRLPTHASDADTAAASDADMAADVAAESPREIPPAYLMPLWEGAVDVSQLREQRRLGWHAAPPSVPGAAAAPAWPHPPLQRPRPPLRRSAGLGELSGDGGAVRLICRSGTALSGSRHLTAS